MIHFLCSKKLKWRSKLKANWARIEVGLGRSSLFSLYCWESEVIAVLLIQPHAVPPSLRTRKPRPTPKSHGSFLNLDWTGQPFCKQSPAQLGLRCSLALTSPLGPQADATQLDVLWTWSKHLLTLFFLTCCTIWDLYIQTWMSILFVLTTYLLKFELKETRLCRINVH